MPFDRYLDAHHHSPGQLNMYDDALDAPPPSQPPPGFFDLHIPPFLTNPAGGPIGMQWLAQANFTNPSSLSPSFQQVPFATEGSDTTPSSTDSPGNGPFDYASPPSSFSSSSPTNHLPVTSDGFIQQGEVTTSELIALKSSSAAIANFNAPSPLGLPVYSTTGFDLLPILARVAMRPNPRVSLGPVDLSCSFAIVNPRMHDHPIVYVSPQFCRLTGYSEAECVGRNCRFLQAPPGVEVAQGVHRQYTDNEAVSHIKCSLTADKECQTSVVNYRKDGSAFINLITIIPITAGGDGENCDEVVYQIGFQIDLTEQPNAILQRLQQGTYKAETHEVHIPQTQIFAQNRKANALPSTRMSKQLRSLLSSQAFLDSLPITPSSLAHSPNPEVNPTSKESSAETGGANNHLLSLLLLDYASDFVIVVSLKGFFLYVAPSVRRALGYEADELIGQSLSDICHPADTVPLTRELKDSSTVSHQPTPASSAGNTNPSFPSSNGSGHPRPVDLLFRAKQKAGTYVWMECRGRLHIEPGKGRKAIILSGRVKPMEAIPWSVLAADSLAQSDGSEFWGLISTDSSARILSVGNGVGPVLGYNAVDLLGKQLMDLSDARTEIEAAVHAALAGKDGNSTLFTMLRRSNQSIVRAKLTIYRPTQRGGASSSKPHSLIYHITLPEGATQIVSSSSTLMRNGADDVFAELQAERTTSWQYELQQLRIENERLHAEMATLEAEVGESLTEEANRRARGYSTSSRPVMPLPSRQSYPTMDTGGGGGGGGGGTSPTVPYQYPMIDAAGQPAEWGAPPSAHVPVFFQTQTPMHN